MCINEIHKQNEKKSQATIEFYIIKKLIVNNKLDNTVYKSKMSRRELIF